MQKVKEKNKKRKWFETKTDVRVFIRSVIELVIIGLVVFMLIRLFRSQNEYAHFDRNDDNTVTGKDNGFICISYLGIDRSGTDTLVSVKNYEKQLSALKALGYVTITQQDIIDYYEKGEALPEKALFLVFEDGRVDTALYSQPALEQNNYIATMLSYADNLTIKDSKKLSSKDLVKLEKSSYWENGTNGYRLSYINVFDRYGRFLGEMDSLEYNSVKKYLGREYNHYLMDYYRDEDYMPLETYDGMKERISYDYELMKETYTKELGYVPGLYILMHSNTDMFGNNVRVSEVNRENMENLFSLNINREGYSVNTIDTDMFDLTRLQAQPYWTVNHLLMRIWDDLDESEKSNIMFVKGDKARADLWDTQAGVSEFEDNEIYLVSLPDGRGLLSLKDSSEYKDVKVETSLTGNYCGDQSIILRSDGNSDSGIKITFRIRDMIVSDNGTEIAKVNLDEIMGTEYVSVEEDERNSLAGEYKMRSGSAETWEEGMAYSMEGKEISEQAVRTVKDGADPYVPVIETHIPAKWDVVIKLKEDKLNISVNGYEALKDRKINTLSAGAVKLESAVLQEKEYNQRNISDDVYEGHYGDLVITSLASEDNDTVLYDNRLHGKEYAGHSLAVWWNKTIDWFVENL
ncbi:MAG: glycoside hydrolase [Lachnospiraceae bacterium]|nr:glycoside hydrolase [Lachnospiraceae bacterium]